MTTPIWGYFVMPRLTIAMYFQYTKYKTIFTSSRDAKIYKWVTWCWPRSFRSFVIPRLKFDMAYNLHTKFENSSISRFRDITENRNMKIEMSLLWVINVTQGHQQYHNSIWHTRNYAHIFTVFETKLFTVLVESRTFYLPHVYLSLRWWWPDFDFSKNLAAVNESF